LRVAAAQDGIGLDLTEGPPGALPDLVFPKTAVQPGEAVLLIGALDLRVVSILCERVGPSGSVHIIESERERLDLALARAAEIGPSVGWPSWRFDPAELDDLRTDPSYVASLLREQPVVDLQSHRALEAALAHQRSVAPLVADDTVDAIVLNRTVNRLSAERIPRLLAESFRVLRRGGRLIVSVVLADEPPPSAMRELSGRLHFDHVPLEGEILAWLGDAGFYGMRIHHRAELPVGVVQGVEFREHVVTGLKGKQGVCLDRGQAVIYRGPWREVLDDDDHRFVRGQRAAVCAKTYELLMRAPYCDDFLQVPPYMEVPSDEAAVFDCLTPQVRDPQVTKGKRTPLGSHGAGTTTATAKCC
jgi:SAM-dependent methyltransferase